MPPTDPHAIRAYAEVLTGILSVVREAASDSRPVWTHAESAERFKSLLLQLRERRQAALVAGVDVGQPIDNMRSLLNNCQVACYGHKRREEQHGSAYAHEFLESNLASCLDELNDLAVLAERQAKAPVQVKEGEPKPELNPSATAVLAIIRSQPPGVCIQGKEIIKKMRERKSPISEATLRKHILPKLKSYGVVNHPAAGGYLIQKGG